MIIAFLINTFLLSSLSAQSAQLPAVLPEAAHASTIDNSMELVEGYDESTAWAFSHSLPKVEEEAGFGPVRIQTDSLGVLTTADSVLVVDKRTKKVLYEKSSQDISPIASITKLVTALTLLDLDIDFSQVVTVKQADNRIGGIVHVFPGEQFTVQDLWMDALIASDNVAIASLVRSTGLTEQEFVEKMNAKVKQLGMQNSSFVEPTGINGNNVSTAADLIKLIDAAMQESRIADTLRRPSYSFSPLNKDAVRTLKTTDKLLNSYINEDPYSIAGGKTGFTYEAGYCLGVEVNGPGENDDLIVVVLGADSSDARFQEVKGLVDWTFNNYRW